MHWAITIQCEDAIVLDQSWCLRNTKWCGTGLIIISADIAVVGRPFCARLQRTMSLTRASVNIPQQQLVQVGLLQHQLPFALHPEEVWNAQHSPSPGLQQLVSALRRACSTAIALACYCSGVLGC